MAETKARHIANLIEDDGDVKSAHLDNVPSVDTGKIDTNMAILGFKTATVGSLAKFNLRDQIVDEFIDSSGVNTTDSLNESLVSGTYGSLPGNYFGDGSDGAFTSDGSDTQTVANKIGSYDGNMLVKQYTEFTVGTGHTYTTDQPCRGLLIAVTGNCTINGTLTMTARGSAANPTSSTASSDENTVKSGGLELGFFTSGGEDTHTNNNTNFNGYGTDSNTFWANQNDLVSNGSVYTLDRTGGPPVYLDTVSGNQNGVDGADQAYDSGTKTFKTGAGGSGGCGSVSSTGNGPASGAGGAFGGGSGSTSVRQASFPGTTADQSYGDAGKTAYSSGNPAAGGVGNPGGAGANEGSYNAEGANGTGGLLILLVGGNLTIGSSGVISANGVQNDISGGTSISIGGSSGGGAVMVFHGGTISNSGSITATGGAAQTDSAFADGGAGGNGSASAIQVLPPVGSTGGADITLISTDTDAEETPTKGDLILLIEDAGSGVASLDTTSGNIKAYVSRYESGGTKTWVQATLVDEGHWGGTDKRILVAHDIAFGSENAGSKMAWQITTHNSSTTYHTKIHAVSMGWK